MSETEQERPRSAARGAGSGGVWEALGSSLDGLVELRKRRPAGPCAGPCAAPSPAGPSPAGPAADASPADRGGPAPASARRGGDPAAGAARRA
ncbi:hypothetical protein [Streptomyces sp. NPDC048606]|uniref:hypothetical protein n=1 Tax=Streptomyces sp. NPDC048606 TaxID=3154726 RepID=UPI0034356174